MTRVAIVSMQRILNYGSTLQGYALRRLLEDVNPTATVTFADYQPGAPLVAPTTGVPRRRLGRIVEKVREAFTVRSALVDKLRYLRNKQHYAEQYLPLVGIPAAPNRDLGVDLEVIGSDEVFNCVQDNPNVGYSRDLFGHGSPARRLVSYAASFGNTTLTKLQATGIIEEVAEDLAGFAAISVRDQNSADVVAALVGATPEIHLDPTLVYDLMSEPRVPSQRLHSGPYIIVYGYSGRLTDLENAAIRDFAKAQSVRVLALGGLQDSADEFIDCDPFTLLAYFRDAEAIVTDTFHGTIFSIINERPFATLIRRSEGHGYGNEEKLGYLLRALGLSSRALTASDNLDTLLDTPIDYEPVRAVRVVERTRTLDYLGRQFAAVGSGA